LVRAPENGAWRGPVLNPGGSTARCGRGIPARTLSAVTEQVTVGRRAARAILIDDQGRLVLIRRTKPGQAPYWTAPGGGVEDADGSVEAALHRELAEELGAEAAGASRVFLYSWLTGRGRGWLPGAWPGRVPG
jgi:8-oxo-dGTP pyrophosphatase MutT (NUDIX family)